MPINSPNFEIVTNGQYVDAVIAMSVKQTAQERRIRRRLAHQLSGYDLSNIRREFREIADAIPFTPIDTSNCEPIVWRSYTVDSDDEGLTQE